MSITAAGTAILAIAHQAGLKEYNVLDGKPATSKLSRLRLPNGRPLVIQTNNKTPRVWMLPEDEAGSLSVLGKREFYEVGRGRHHHLNQVREFKDRALVKVEVGTSSWPVIKAAFETVGGRRGRSAA
jgi:hypothetical protein